MLPGVSPGLTGLAALGVALGVALPIASILAMGQLIGRVPAALAGGAGSPAADHLWAAFAVVAGLYLAQQTVVPLLNLCTAQLSRRFAEQLELRAMACVSQAPGTAHLEDPDTLDDIERASGRAGSWPAGPAISAMSSVWTARFTALGSGFLLFSFHWWVALPLIAAPVLLLRYWSGFFTRTTETLFGENQQVRRSTYLSNLLMAAPTAAEVRVFALLPFFLRRSDALWRGTMAGVFASWRKERLRAAGAMVLSSGLPAAAILLIAYEGVQGTLALSQVSVLLSAVFGVAALGNVSDEAYQISMCLASLPALAELEQRLDAAHPTGEQAVPAGMPQQRIAFEGVHFTYPGRGMPVYDGLDLVLEAGRSTAIVGINGAGKTTLVKLLARMREPDAGRITVDGVDLATLDPTAWQRQVAAIFQGFVRYELSAHDNIALGAPEHQHDVAAVRAAAARAGIAEAIEALPGGWDTPLSRQFEGGAELSGGQWQRLALARALFATAAGPATVLVLDEPTASLDVRTEADLYERFLDLTAGLTTLVISHRFSTVRKADCIVVLDQGRIVEQGSHDELVALGGRYAELFTLQAARYIDLPALEHLDEEVVRG